MIYKVVDSKTALGLLVGGSQVLAVRNTSKGGYVYIYTRAFQLFERHEKSGIEQKCSLTLAKALETTWYVCNGVTPEERLTITGERETVIVAEYTGKWDPLASNTSEVFAGQKVFVLDTHDKREYYGLSGYLALHSLCLTLLRYSAQEGGCTFAVQSLARSSPPAEPNG